MNEEKLEQLISEWIKIQKQKLSEIRKHNSRNSRKNASVKNR